MGSHLCAPAVGGRRTPRRLLLTCLGLALATSAALSIPTTAQANGDGAGAAATRTGDPGGGSEGILARRASAPSNRDVPMLPRKCARPRDLIPRTAMKCNLNPHIPGAPTIVLWGDSHAWQMIAALRSEIGSRKINLVGFLFGGCPAMDPRFKDRAERERAGDCLLTGDLAVRFLTNQKAHHRVARVVVAMGWELYHNNTTPPDATDAEFQGYTSEGLETTGHLGLTRTPHAFGTLGRLHMPTDVVAPMPMVPQNAPYCAAGMRPYQCNLPRRGAIVDEQDNLAHIHDLMSRLTKPARLIHAAEYVCGANTCRGINRGLTTYFDLLHIGARVSAGLGPHYFRGTVDRLLAAARRH